jgi:hypothetical protein
MAVNVSKGEEGKQAYIHCGVSGTARLSAQHVHAAALTPRGPFNSPVLNKTSVPNSTAARARIDPAL